MFTILLATHNVGKLKRYKELFSQIVGLDIKSLKDLNIDFIADEPYKTSEENSVHKAKEYGRLSGLPTIAIDEAVMTNFLPHNEQPGVFVRRLGGGKELNDCDILDLWKNIFSIYPVDNRKFIWDFSFSFYNPIDDFLKTINVEQINTVADKFSEIIDPGYPMSSFLIPEGFSKPCSELSKEESLTVNKKNMTSFLDFLKILVENKK